MTIDTPTFLRWLLDCRGHRYIGGFVCAMRIERLKPTGPVWLVMVSFNSADVQAQAKTTIQIVDHPDRMRIPRMNSYARLADKIDRRINAHVRTLTGAVS